MAIETTSDLSLVGTSQIVDGSVTSAKISAGAVGSAALADNAVVAAKIAAGSVGTVAISSGSATSGQILQANGSGAVTFATPSSGGGLTLIATATPSAATTVSFSSIPTTYKNLLLVWKNVYQSATGKSFGIRINNDTTANGHKSRGLVMTGADQSTTVYLSVFDSTQFASTSAFYESNIIPNTTTSSADSFQNSYGFFQILEYANTATGKYVNWQTTGSSGINFGQGWFGGTAAITQIDFIRDSTQTVTGTFYLYGVS